MLLRRVGLTASAGLSCKLCRDCGLGCFSELLADIERLLVVAMVFLYEVTVFFTTKHHRFTFGTLL